MLGLWLGNHHALAYHSAGLPTDSQFPGLEVQVIPLEGGQFTLPQAGGEFQKEDLVIALLFGLNEYLLHFFSGQDLHFLSADLGQLAMVGRVLLDQPLGYGLFQHSAAEAMYILQNAVRESSALDAAVLCSAILLHPGVELLEVIGGQLIQRDMAQLGLNI